MNNLENPFAQATVENFRKIPLRLRRQLLEELRAELAHEDTPPTTFRRVPAEDRTAELSWIAAHTTDYAGQWVALSGNQLLAHHADYHEVSLAVKKQGAKNVMFGSGKIMEIIFPGCSDRKRV